MITTHNEISFCIWAILLPFKTVYIHVYTCILYVIIQNDKGKYECRFLFVELKGNPKGTIVIEDNR